jgi:TolB-like protein/class 3 adenylate cyclase
MTGDDFKRKLTAVFSADVVGYSRLMRDDESATVKILETYKGVMISLIKQHRGSVVDSPGDNLLAEFGSVVDAVQCAVSIQKEIQTRNADLPENRRMEFRIGINLGDVIEEDDKIYGDGVNIAARLEALADPGGICISKTAFDYIENKLPFGYRFIGDQTVKNIGKPVSAYKILTETRLIDEEDRKAKAPFWRRMAVVLSTGIILILAIAGALYWNCYSRTPSIESDQAPVVSDLKDTPKSIAVLPFSDLSPEKDQEYFVDGLSEEILNSLVQIPELNVIGRTSSFSFKGSNKKAKDIAAELGVGNILEGSVRKAGDALRITAQLLRGSDGFHLWSETYDHELKDIFAVQEEIAKAVADELRITLGVERSPGQLGGTDNVKAYEYYLAAKGLIGRGSANDPTSLTIEQGFIDSAIDLDPEFALAWVRKGAIHNQYVLFRPTKFTVAERDVAFSAVNRAIELAPNLALGYYYLGSIKTGSGDFIGGEMAIRKVFELKTEPFCESESSVTAIYHYWPVGHLKRAHEIIEKARRNDPLYPSNRHLYIASFSFIGDTQQAEEKYKQIRELVGQNPMDDQAITLVRLGTKNILTRDDIVFSASIFDVAKKYLDSPKEGLSELRRLYTEDDMSFWDLSFVSMWAAYFGDPEFAMEALEKGVKTHASGMAIAWWPVMREVRQLHRFKKFVREIGLVDYWNEFGWPDLCHPVGDDDFKCD